MPISRRFFRRRFAIALIILTFVGLLILGIVVGTHPILGFDVSISKKIQTGGVGYLPFMRFVSVFGSGPLLVGLPILFSGLFFALNKKREAIFLLGTFAADIINILLKQAIHRPRPAADIINIYQNLTDPSFPSAHVVHYVVFFGFLAVSIFTVRRIPFYLRLLVSSLSLILIALVSVSRVYLGAHWTTDVIGGYLVGFFLLATMFLLYFEPTFRDP